MYTLLYNNHAAEMSVYSLHKIQLTVQKKIIGIK